MSRHLVTAAALFIAGSVSAAPAAAAPGAGTIDDPIVVDAFPYAIAGDTTGAAAQIDFYDCAPSTDETGPEHVYRFELAEPARVTAWVEGDDGVVDIDVQLLAELQLSGAEASTCLSRGNRIAEAEMAAGEHFVVVDSYAGAAQAGPYVLHLEAIGDYWIERPVAEGVIWRARRYADLDGPQVIHEVEVDTSLADVSIRAIAASGCQTVGALGEAAGAVAGINGGYFNTGGGCAPVSLLKESGSLVGVNSVTRGAFGLTADMVPMVEIIPSGQDWAAAYEAHGGGPVLVVGGVAYAGSSAWADQGFTSSSFNGNNPRTLAGYDAAGRSHLVTIDGRRPTTAAGMSLDEEAAFAQADIGLDEAVNLDGGGSTTMWIAGRTPNGVVNYPSDAGQVEQPTHPGSRPCSGGFFVFAPAYNHPPRFQTEPPETAAVGSAYSYDADAIDLDVYDVITYALAEAPAGMSIDAVTGEVSFSPTVSSPPSATVTITATDDHGGEGVQSYLLTIEGGQGTGGEGGSGGAGGEGGAGASDGAESGIPGGAQDAGCSCAVPGPRQAGFSWAALGLWLAALALRRRCR